MKKCVLSILFLGIVCVSYADNVKKSVDNLRLDNTEDNGDNDESKDVAMEIPEIEPENKTQLCSARREFHHMHPIMNATDQMFPFMVSCLSLSDEHLCSGTVISNGMILTAASCIAKQINAVLTHTIKTDLKYPGSIRLSVIKTENFPSYNGEESLYNVGIIYTWKHNSSVASKIKVSNFTNAQRLIEMEVIGFGLNELSGKDPVLQYIGVEHRYHDQPGNTLRVYIDCIETKEPTCFTDYGGPALYGNELVGIVVSGSDHCINEISAQYAINKEIGVILPTYSFKDWLDEKIKAYEENTLETIPTFPHKLVGTKSKLTPHQTHHKHRSAPKTVVARDHGNDLVASKLTYYFIITLYLLCLFPFYFH